MINKRAIRTPAVAFPAIGILILSLANCANQPGMSTTDETGADSRKSNIRDYVGNYDAAVYPQGELEAFFTFWGRPANLFHGYFEIYAGIRQRLRQ